MWSSRQPCNLRTWSLKGSEFPSPTLGELRRSHTWVLRGTTGSAKFIALVAPDTKIYQAPEEGNPWTGAGHQVGGHKFFCWEHQQLCSGRAPSGNDVEKILEVVLEETYLGPVTALTIFDPKIIAGWIRIGRTGDSDLSWPRLPRGWKSHIGFGCFFFLWTHHAIIYLILYRYCFLEAETDAACRCMSQF